MSDLIPAGAYAAVGIPVQTEQGAAWAQFGKSQNKGTLQVYVAFAVLDGPYAGRRLGWFGYFTDNTVERTIESLRLCGLKGDDLAAAVTGPLDQEVQLVVEHETYDGKTRAKVVWVNAPGGGAFRMANPMNTGDLRKFAASMKAKMRGKPEVAGARREAPAVTAPPAPSEALPQSQGEQPLTPSDEEIPF
jgi:hypothetical protein